MITCRKKVSRKRDIEKYYPEQIIYRNQDVENDINRKKTCRKIFVKKETLQNIKFD